MFSWFEYPWINRCHGNVRHILSKILSESKGVLLYFNDKYFHGNKKRSEKSLILMFFKR